MKIVSEQDLFDARGWPALSMYSWQRTLDQTELQLAGFKIQSWEWQGVPGALKNRFLPTLPLWPGFAINTIFYAAILWLLWIAPGKIRRFVRIRGHRCPACGFIIAPNTCANGLCSECGARLPKSLRRSEGM